MAGAIEVFMSADHERLDRLLEKEQSAVPIAKHCVGPLLRCAR